MYIYCEIPCNETHYWSEFFEQPSKDDMQKYSLFFRPTNKLFLICRLFSLNVVLLAKVKPYNSKHYGY